MVLQSQISTGTAQKSIGSLLHSLFTVGVAMEENHACAALSTNQVGYIYNTIAQLPRIYGNVNCPCPHARPRTRVGF